MADIGDKKRVSKRPISAPQVLNEAYNYGSRVSFVRGMRVEMGDFATIYISGTSSVDENGKSIHYGDIEAQALRTFQNIRALLEAEGADFHDVVRTTIYLADMRDYGKFNKVRNAFYDAEGLNPFPAATCIGAPICREDLMVEIEAIAIVPADRPKPG